MPPTSEPSLSQTVAFLGAGNMARAIAGGLLRAGMVRAQQLIASDVSPAALEELGKATGARAAKSNIEAVSVADVIILAVKPHQVAEVCREVRSAAAGGPATAGAGGPLFISICAGVGTTTIERSLVPERMATSMPEDSTVPTTPLPPRVIRVMPNTPALIGAGSAAVAPGRFATKDDTELALKIFRSVGTAVQVDESKLDLVTGVSGSGPAYLFRFIECLVEAAVELGLSREEAGILIPQMVHGASRMAVESNRSLAELRTAVTTKGGTTEAGLNVLEAGGFPALIRDAVAAAAKRSAELSGGG